MKKNDIILIILFAMALAFEVWILNIIGKHSEERKEKNWIETPSDDELDSVEFELYNFGAGH